MLTANDLVLLVEGHRFSQPLRRCACGLGMFHAQHLHHVAEVVLANLSEQPPACVLVCADEGHPGHAAPTPIPARPVPADVRLFFSPDDIDESLRTIRGSTTRAESIVMAAAAAAASSMRSGCRVVEAPDRRRP